MKLNTPSLFLLPIAFVAVCSSNGAFANSPQNIQGNQNIAMFDQDKMKTNPIEIIIDDHNRIRKMIGDLNKQLDSDLKEARKLFKALKDFLVKHETMEQKAWYPELEKKENLKKLIQPLKNEENAAANAIKKIETTKDDKAWVEKVKALMKDVEHHANEEETRLFPDVRNAFDKSELEKIGEKLMEYRKKNKM